MTQAMATLGELRTKAPDNGFVAFLLAAAYAKEADWEAVGRERDAGSRAPACVQYAADRWAPSLPPQLTGAAAPAGP